MNILLCKCVPQNLFTLFLTNDWSSFPQLSEKVQLWLIITAKKLIHSGMYSITQCQYSIICFTQSMPFYHNLLPQGFMLIPWTKTSWMSEMKLLEECRVFFILFFYFSIYIKLQPNVHSLKHVFFFLSAQALQKPQLAFAVSSLYSLALQEQEACTAYFKAQGWV